MKRRFKATNHILNFLSVILGVYLAFYVSDQAKLKEQRKEVRYFMNSLADELSKDVEMLETYQIPFNRQQVERLEELLVKLEEGDIPAVEALLPTILELENFGFTSTSYAAMKSSGKLGLVQDVSLQGHLTNYFDGHVEESFQKAELQVVYLTDEILPWLTQHVDLGQMRFVSRDAFLPFKNKLIIYSSLISQKVDSYEIVVAEAKEVVTYLETHQQK